LDPPPTPADFPPSGSADQAVELAGQEEVRAQDGSGATESAVAGRPGSPDGGAELEVLAALQQQLNRIQRRVRLELQAQLASLSGRSLGTLQANRELAGAIQQLLQTHSLRVRCQQCGHPAILRASPRKGMPGGAFVFDHKINGKRTFHGGTPVVPTLQLTTKPPRGGS